MGRSYEKTIFDGESRNMKFIDIQQQYQRYRSDIDVRMHQVLEAAQFIMGPEVQELEGVLADYVGVRHCITTGSGTVSLEIALRALGIGPGDEVITVPFTWISTAEVIAQVGARPVGAIRSRSTTPWQPRRKCGREPAGGRRSTQWTLTDQVAWPRYNFLEHMYHPI